MQKPYEEQLRIGSSFDVDGRIGFLQAERRRLLIERKKPKQKHAEINLRLEIARAELQALYESKRSSKKGALAS